MYLHRRRRGLRPTDRRAVLEKGELCTHWCQWLTALSYRAPELERTVTGAGVWYPAMLRYACARERCQYLPPRTISRPAIMIRAIRSAMQVLTHFSSDSMHNIRIRWEVRMP